MRGNRRVGWRAGLLGVACLILLTSVAVPQLAQARPWLAGNISHLTRHHTPRHHARPAHPRPGHPRQLPTHRPSVHARRSTHARHSTHSRHQTRSKHPHRPRHSRNSIRRAALPRHAPQHRSHPRHSAHQRRTPHPRHRKAFAPRPTKRHPWTLRIPSIGVRANMIRLGFSASAGLPVPSLSDAFQVGWYGFSSVPGRPGNSVLVGHVDTYLGPAVFYDLYLLRPGNSIYIQLNTKRIVRYTVRSIRELPKSSLPVDQIFSTTHAHRLWLITCGGPFDYATRHYLDNIVVSASE